MRTALFVLVLTTCTYHASPVQVDEPTQEQLRTWIEELANEQPARRFETPDDRLTKTERASLEKVENAYRQLTEHFLLALPSLIEHLDDDRYSFPTEHPTSGVFQNQSVGQACRSIVQRKVLIRNPTFIDHREIAVWIEMPIDSTWYNRVSKMSLFEMQIDSLDWLLKQPKITGVPDQQWNDEMKKIRDFRTKFQQEGRAIDHVFGPTIEGR